MRKLLAVLGLLAAFAAPASAQLTIADFVIPADRYVYWYMLVEVEVIVQNASLTHLWCSEPRSNCPGNGTVIDGTATIHASPQLDVGWIRYGANFIRFNRSTTTSGSLEDLLEDTTDELGESTWHVQTTVGASAFSSNSITDAQVGGGFVNLFSGGIAGLVDDLVTGDRMLVVLTLPGEDPNTPAPCGLRVGDATLTLANTRVGDATPTAFYLGDTQICEQEE